MIRQGLDYDYYKYGKGPSGRGEEHAQTDGEFQQKNRNYRKVPKEDARNKRKCYNQFLQCAD